MTREKKQILLWSLYDFANSLGFIAVAFYFSLWFVSDNNKADIWISATAALATLVLLFTLPVFGVMSDRLGKRMPFLKIFTFLAFFSLFGLGFFANYFSVLTLSATIVIILFYFLFQYFYQGGLAFYSAFLPDLSAGKSLEKISGFGIAAGQLGNVVGLVLALLVASGNLSVFGINGRPATFLVASLAFLIFVLPTLFGLKDKLESVSAVSKSKINFGQTFKEIVRDLRHIKKYPGVLTYLMSYYFFADASLTVLLFGTLYLEVVGGLNDAQKTLVGVISLIFTIIGALVAEKVANISGSLKKGLSFTLLLEAIFLMVFAFSTNRILFMTMVVLNGFAFGLLFSLSRAFYSRLIPSGEQAKFFSIYVLFERFASILGPLVWSLTAIVFAFLGNVIKYRLAMASLALLIVISFVIFKFVKEPEI